MLPLERWHMPSRKVVADMCRELLRADVVVQRAVLGDDFRKKLDGFAVFVAAYDYAVATLSNRGVAVLAASPQVSLLPAPADNVSDLDAPSIELVLYLRYLAYSLDIDSLDEMDAVDLEQERDWCDYWYSWHASHLDAS